jgi:hypothetical protein
MKSDNSNAADALSRMTSEPEESQQNLQQVYVAPGGHYHDAVPAPTPQQQPIVYVQVPAQSQQPPGLGMSMFGLVAIALGLFALVLSWVPFISIGSVYVGIVGAGFGVLGLLVSAAGRRSSVAAPIAGMLLCGIAVYVSFHTSGLKFFMDASRKPAPQSQSPAAREQPKQLTDEEVAAAQAGRAAANAADANGMTPLHHAARAGDLQRATQLIEDGAEVNAVSKMRWTPLHLAAWHGREDVTELLIKCGADVNAKGDGGQTPLEMAIKYKQSGTAKLLRGSKGE